MYGTVMIGKLKGSAEEMQARSEKWRAERGDSIGYIDQWVLKGDDGRFVVAVRFNSKDEYLKLADDPAQDEWWSTQMMPLIDGEPEWIDGEWQST